MDEFEFLEQEMADNTEAQKIVLTLDTIDAYNYLINYIIELENRAGIDPNGFGLDEETTQMRNAALNGFTALGEMVARGVLLT